MSNWIKNAIKTPGGLHHSLGVPLGKKIPASKIDAARHSKNGLLKKRAILAATLGKFKKSGPKRSTSY